LRRRARFVTFDIISAMVLIALFITGCFQSGETDPTASGTTQPSAEISEQAAQGGNLHYQNLVLYVNGEIFFNSSSGFLSKASEDGSMLQGILNESGGNLSSDGQRLFYTEDSLVGALAKINLDGSSPVRIRSTAMKYLICGQNCLYGIETSTGLPVQINKDGTNRKPLADFQAVSMVLADQQLFVTGADEKNGLTVIHLVSGEKEVLLDKKIASLNAAGEWLYYSVPEDSSRIYAFSLIQKTETNISRFSIDRPFIVSGSYLYFINAEKQGRLYRIAVSRNEPLKLEKAEMFVDDLVDSFVVCGSFLYYRRPSSSRIYRVSIENQEVLRIT
jgi:hypothetical protein